PGNPQTEPGPRPQLLKQQRRLAKPHLALEGPLQCRCRRPGARRGSLLCCHCSHPSTPPPGAANRINGLVRRKVAGAMGRQGGNRRGAQSARGSVIGTPPPCIGHVSVSAMYRPCVAPHVLAPPCLLHACLLHACLLHACLLHACFLHACLLHVTLMTPADAPASVPRVPFPPRGCSSSELELVAPGKLLGVAHAWLGVTDRDRHHRDRRRHGHRSSHRGRWA